MRVDAVPDPALVTAQRLEQRKVFHAPNIDSVIGRRRRQCAARNANEQKRNENTHTYTLRDEPAVGTNLGRQYVSSMSLQQRDISE